MFIAEALESFSPGLIAAARLALGAATLAMFPQSRHPIGRDDWPSIFALALVWMAIPFIALPVAQLWISSSLAGMINGGMPLFAAVFAAMMLGRLPRRFQAVGLAVGFVGVVLIATPRGGVGTTSLSGILLALLATACYGVAVNLAVPLQQRYGALPVLLRAITVAAVLLAPVGLLSLPDGDVSGTSVAAVVALGALGTGLAYIAMATLVGRAGATRGSIAVYFIPIVAVVLGVQLRNESVSASALLGIGLVLVGAFLTSRRETRLPR